MSQDELSQGTLSVPEEIEKLTQKVKQANIEISGMEQQTSETLDSINKIRAQIVSVEKAIQESKSAWHTISTDYTS